MHLCAGEIWGINASHPAWGEWIEIRVDDENALPVKGLTPHGVSGLKLVFVAFDFTSSTSHPAWGEWIEIAPGRAKTRQGYSPTSYGQQKYCAITAFVKSHIKYLTNMNQCAIIIAL